MLEPSGPFEFAANLPTELHRRAVRVEVLVRECGVSREDLLDAAKRDPSHCFTYTFTRNGIRSVTHIAYTPDGAGFEPPAPISATTDFGEQREPAPAQRQQQKRSQYYETSLPKNQTKKKKTAPARQPFAPLNENERDAVTKVRELSEVLEAFGRLRVYIPPRSKATTSKSKSPRRAENRPTSPANSPMPSSTCARPKAPSSTPSKRRRTSSSSSDY
mmetsp:Transcript_8637/g.26513  ORF Transcript_8637/g.26513 Transcript_8637/m.26513 type:complete len:217 (+) Transcript_8637:186-836(+)